MSIQIKSVAPGRMENQIVVTLVGGMILEGKDVKWSGGRFIAWSGREYEDRQTGKKKTWPAIRWESKEIEAEFNDRVFAVIDGKPSRPATAKQGGFGAAQADDGELPF